MEKIPVMITCALLCLSLIAGCTTRPVAQSAVPATPAQVPVALTPAVPPELAQKWVLTIMAVQNGTAPLAPTTEITLVMNPDGSLTGYGGCNNYFASYTLTGTKTIKGDGISMGPVSASKKYCEINGPQETTYLGVLQKVMAYSLNPSQMTLTDSEGNTLVYRLPSVLPATPYYPHPA